MGEARPDDLNEETADGQSGQLRRQEHARRGRQVLRDLPARRGRPATASTSTSLPFSLKVLLENLLRTEDGADITADDIRALAGWDADAEPEQGDPVHAGARDHAGLHRRALRRRPGHHARGDGRPRRRRRPRSTRSRRPSWSSTTPSSPTSSARPRRSSATSRSSTSATASATSSCAGARAPSTTSRSSRPAPASCTRSTSSTSPASSSPASVDGELTAYPDTCVGTDSHTTMVNGIGVVGWGVGGIEAEAAMLGQPVSMLIPRVVGFKLDRRPARGRDRDRPGADHHRDAAQARRGRQVRRVLRPRRLGAAAGQPRHDRQHEPGVRLDDRGLPDRRGDPRLPRAHRPLRGAARAGRGLRQGAGPLARPGRRAALLREARARPRRPSSRRWPARSARRTGSRSPTPRSRSAPRCADYVDETDAEDGLRRGGRRVLPGLATRRRHDGGNGAGAAARATGAGAPAGGRPSNPVDGHARRTARRSSSTTARSRSRRSRPAPTRPTRR